MKKKIIVVNPIVSEKWNDDTQKVLNRYLSPGFELKLVNVKYGGMESSTGLAEVVALPYIIQEILKAAQEGYDAVIPNCFVDPGVVQSRPLVNIPVVGPGESALHIACMLGYRVGIISPDSTPTVQLHGKGWSQTYQFVASYGLSDRVVFNRELALAGEDLGDAELTSDALRKASLKLIEEDGVEVLILGCTFMTGYAKELQTKLDIPVVEPTVAALKMAEVLITMNLKQSRLAFPSKEGKSPVKYPPTLNPYTKKHIS